MYRTFKQAALVSVVAVGTMLPGALLAKEKSRCGGEQTSTRFVQRSEARIADQVRHKFAMLPYYGVFDNLEFRVNGCTVTLLDQASRPSLKSDAENVTKREGVNKIRNKIEVLPLPE